MSNFNCPHCGKPCIDSPRGYVTGCEHYPADVGPQKGPASVRQIEAQVKATKRRLAELDATATDEGGE